MGPACCESSTTRRRDPRETLPATRSILGQGRDSSDHPASVSAFAHSTRQDGRHIHARRERVHRWAGKGPGPHSQRPFSQSAAPPWSGRNVSCARPKDGDFATIGGVLEGAGSKDYTGLMNQKAARWATHHHTAPYIDLVNLPVAGITTKAATALGRNCASSHGSPARADGGGREQLERSRSRSSDEGKDLR